MLAPFEGLHRRTGYEALAAMRLALDTYEGKEISIIPLALHADYTESYDERRLQRTVQKLLADSAVQAVVGPYDPYLAPVVASTYHTQTRPWFLPLLPDIGAGNPVATFAANGQQGIVTATLLAGIAKQAQDMGAKRLIIAGWSQQMQKERLTVALAEKQIVLPYILLEGDAIPDHQLDANDAFVWLGTPEAAIRLFEEGRSTLLLANSVWFGPLGGDPVLPELLLRDTIIESNTGEQDLATVRSGKPSSEKRSVVKHIYWTTWLADGADISQEPMSPATVDMRTLSPMAALTFRATQAAIATIDPTYQLPLLHWRIGYFQLQADGSSQPMVVAP